jgi:serine/threonine protein kinase
MIVVRQKSHQLIDLGTSPLFTGGEAKIYAFPNDASIVAKIYDKPQEGDRLKRVSTLIDRPFPKLPSETGGLVTPEEWLTDCATGAFVGFAMRRVLDAHPILGTWNPKSADYRPFSARCRIAKRLARLFIELEAHPNDVNYCDLNPQNVLIDANDAVWLIDMDSCQMRGLSGQVLVTPMRTIDFLSPRLQGKNLEHLMRSRADERFALGTLFFKMLMNGCHPHAARSVAANRDVPETSERIRRGIWTYGNNPSGNFLPPLGAPEFGLLPEKIRELFERCFAEGFNDSSRRPSAQEWFDVFDDGVNVVSKPDQSPNPHSPQKRPTIVLPVVRRKQNVWALTGTSVAIVVTIMFAFLRSQSAATTSDWSYDSYDSNRFPSTRVPKEGLPTPILIREVRTRMTTSSTPPQGLPAPILIRDIRTPKTRSSPRSVEAGAQRPLLVQQVSPGNPLEEQRFFSRTTNALPRTPSPDNASPKTNEKLGVLGHLRRAFEEMANEIEAYFSPR